MKPSLRLHNLSIFSNNHKNTLKWEPKCQRALYSLDHQVLVKPFLPELVQDRLEFLFTMFQDQILFKNTLVWVLRESENYLIKLKKLHPVSFSLIKLMPSVKKEIQDRLLMNKETTH